MWEAWGAPIQKRYTVGACAVVAAAGRSGHDPVLTNAGPYYPAWLVCALADALGCAAAAAVPRVAHNAITGKS
jgi:hypothetical protein